MGSRVLGRCGIAATLAAAIVAMVLPAGAQAVGEIGFDNCLASEASAGTAGCLDLAPSGSAGPLDGAESVAVSPDNRSVYVASFDGDSISHFNRDPGSGDLVYQGCLANETTTSLCFDLAPAGPGGPLDGPISVAVSPDNRSVYVASNVSDSVTHFTRSLGAGDYGQLQVQGCLANDAAVGCVDLGPAGATGPLDLASSVAVSPDNRSVYATAYGSNTVIHFTRSIEAGDYGFFYFQGCVASEAVGGTAGCLDLAPAGLGGPLGAAGSVAVSPDNRSLYVAAYGSNAVTHFTRSIAPGDYGYFYFQGCLANEADDETAGCGDLGPAGAGGPLTQATSVAVSPDNRSLYVGSYTSNAVTHFSRSIAPGDYGYFYFQGCLANQASGGTAGCTDLAPAGAGGPLWSVESVAVSPDSRSVYAASSLSESITHFSRSLGAGDYGSFHFQGCLANEATGGPFTAGCVDLAPAGSAGPLAGAREAAVSHDNRSVYVASYGSDSVSHFNRVPVSAPGSPGGVVPATTPGAATVDPRCAKLRKKLKKAKTKAAKRKIRKKLKKLGC